jgi:hypothetical protein
MSPFSILPAEPVLAGVRETLGPQQTLLLAAALAVRIRESPDQARITSHADLIAWLHAVPVASPGQIRNTAFAAVPEQTALEKIDPRVLGALLDFFRDTLAAGHQRELADELARQWVLAQHDSVIVPSPEIARFMVEATRAPLDQRIRCPRLASEPIALACMRIGRLPVVIAETPPYMALFYALLTDSPIDFEQRIPGVAPGPKVIVPTFRRAEIDFDRSGRIFVETDWSADEQIALHEAALRESGCTVVLVSTRALFARGASAQKFRRFLIDSGRLRSVISFPAGPLTDSAVPFSILVFDDSPDPATTRTVFCKVDEDLHFTFSPGQLRTRSGSFTGGPDILRAMENPHVPWCRSVDRAEIARRDYILAVGRYLDTGPRTALERAARDRRIVSLADLATVIKAQSLRSRAASAGVPMREISPSEFPEFGYLKEARRERLIDPEDRKRYEQQVILNGDVLLSTKGTIGRTAIGFPKNQRAPIVASPSTVILRLKPSAAISDPVVLLMYLRSPLFQSLLRAVVVGSTIPNVSLFDLRKLPVVIPSHDEQRRLRQVFDAQVQLQQQLRDLQQQQATLARDVYTAFGLAETEKST